MADPDAIAKLKAKVAAEEKRAAARRRDAEEFTARVKDDRRDSRGYRIEHLRVPK